MCNQINKSKLLSEVKNILNSYLHRHPFNGGATYELEDNKTVTINYPVTETESSLISYIEENEHPEVSIKW